MNPTPALTPMWSKKTDTDTCRWTQGYHQGSITGYHQGSIKLSNMRKAARDGCVRCKLLLRGIERYTFPPRRPHRTTEATLSEHEPHRSLRVTVSNEPDTPLRVRIRHIGMATKSGSLPMKLYFYTDPDKPPCFSDIEPAGHIPADPASQACFDTIRKWTRNCNALHPQCSPKTDISTTPTRLISVGSSSDDIKLCSSSGMPADTHYVALSHAWGVKEDRMKAMPLLLNDNVSSRMSGIPWAELTQTFQDAVTITRNISIPYIWIDSLCIVQDDHVDWAKEASRMAAVYKHAYLVIAATSAKNGDHGCLRPRDPSHDLVDSANGSLHVQRQISHSTIVGYETENTDTPLLDRAWCFQERLLARRVLHYTEQEMVWECQEKLWCECQTIKFDISFPPRPEILKHAYAAAVESVDPKIRAKSWDKLVERYSELALTFETDRLPGISGIAREIALPVLGTYLAGLWEYQLPQALLWTSTGRVIDRPSQYLAPTWSWASIVTAVHPFGWEGWQRPMTTVCRVVDITCTPNTSDLYGHVRDGQLDISGLTIAATLKFRDRKYGPKSYDVILEIPNTETPERSVGVIVRSDIESLEDTVTVVILLIHVRADSTMDPFAEGLALVQSKTHNGCWERVGRLEGYGLDLSQWKEGEFIIV